MRKILLKRKNTLQNQDVLQDQILEFLSRYEPRLNGGQAYSCANAATAQEFGYDSDEALVFVDVICPINERLQISREVYGEQLAITYCLAKGIKNFGDRGVKSVHKEIRQLHDRDS